MKMSYCHTVRHAEVQLDYSEGHSLVLSVHHAVHTQKRHWYVKHLGRRPGYSSRYWEVGTGPVYWLFWY